MEPDLYRALRTKDIRSVRDCLADWGNKNRWIWWAGGNRYLSPLHVASKGSSKDILMELLRHPEISCSINESTDKASVTPLHVAAGNSSPEVVILLLNAGADISSRSGDSSTAFHIACARGRLETCAELLRRGAVLEARDGEQRTPLMRAAACGRPEVTRWLLEHGADPRAVDSHGNSALALSCRATSLDPARALLEFGASVGAENSEGQSCAYLAAISGRTELLDIMLDAMARSGQRLRDGGGAMLYDAVEHGLSKVVQLLGSRRGKELGVNVSRRNPSKSDTTPLHAAVFRGRHGIVNQLLEYGACPNQGNESGLGSLHFACAIPNSQPIVRSLLKAKADANAKDNCGCTPLYYAFVRGNDDIVHYLLARGASLFKMEYDQALRIACFYGMVQEVESLLWMEADPNSLAANRRDRGSDFHVKVSPTVRDGVRELLAEAMADACSGGAQDGVDSNSSDHGKSESKIIAAAREAATAWGGVGEECYSPTGTLDPSDTSSFSSADTSTTAVSRGGWHGRDGLSSGSSSGQESSCGSTLLDDDRLLNDVNAVKGAGHASRRFHSGSTSTSQGTEESSCSDGSVTLPPLSTLKDDLVRVPDVASTSSPTTGAAAVVKRWGQRVVRGVGSGGCGDGATTPTSAKKIPGKDVCGSDTNSPCRPSVKDRAHATIAGVVKWATSPRNRSRGIAGS